MGGGGGGVSASQGLSVSCYGDEVEVRVCESACTQAGCWGARRSQGSHTALLACGPLLQPVLETHYSNTPFSWSFCCLREVPQQISMKSVLSGTFAASLKYRWLQSRDKCAPWTKLCYGVTHFKCWILSSKNNIQEQSSIKELLYGRTPDFQKSFQSRFFFSSFSVLFSGLS